MNYYNLSSFPQVSSNELIKKFHLYQTIRKGALSIFGDSVGKPGDIIYQINEISKIEKNGISIDFGGLKINIFEVNGLIINEKVIGICECSKIEWIDKHLKLEYEIQDKKLITRIKEGTHRFKSNIKNDALLIYSW